MHATNQFLADMLADKKIDEAEVPVIREYLDRDGPLDLEDVKLLIELYCTAREYCPAFEDLFFEVLEKVMLADGQIGPAEQFYLLKMLYSDRHVREREKEFLLRLRRRATHSSPEFDALCAEAFRAHPTQWDVGGR